MVGGGIGVLDDDEGGIGTLVFILNVLILGDLITDGCWKAIIGLFISGGFDVIVVIEVEVSNFLRIFWDGDCCCIGVTILLLLWFLFLLNEWVNPNEVDLPVFGLELPFSLM